MRSFRLVLSAAALVVAAFAVEFNTIPSTFEAGQTYTITYSPKDQTPTTLILRQGDPNNLDTVATLTTSATGGSYTWTVPRDLKSSPNYALEIRQEGQAPNYSGLIPLTGGSASASTTVKSATSSVASSVLASAQSSTVTPTASLSKLTHASASTHSYCSTTLLTSAGTISASVSSFSGANSTISAPTLTGTGSPTSSGPPESTGAASMLGSSPVALLVGAVAALAFF